MMEGDSPELEIDSELVMSFYDQYQVPLYLDSIYSFDSLIIITSGKDFHEQYQEQLRHLLTTYSGG